MEESPVTFDEMLSEENIPAVAADHEGIIFFVNDAFEKEYGWNKADLTGNALTTIVPPHMRTAHNLGFSRFLTTQTQRILNKRIPLPVYCKNQSVRTVIHLITAKEEDGEWQFAALLYPNQE